jgi:two-component system, OmpR family, phosphate regulon sensor histidine kinase PhoR
MKPTNRIAIILTVIFLIPVLFFSVYEITSLSKDEEMIQDIYSKQLEAILFSVNQYSDDALNSWISKIESSNENNPINSSFSPTLLGLLELNSSVHALFVVDTIKGKPRVNVLSLDSLVADSLHYFVEEAAQQSAPQIQQLIKYRKSGFQKAEAIKYKHNVVDSLKMIVFITEEDNQVRQVAGIIINPETFIEDMVGPRLQIISKDQFILSVVNNKSGTVVYSTVPGDTISLTSLSKDLWIFPDYSLGIRTQGASLNEIVRERTKTNLLLLVGLDVILIIALLIAFNNIKKEVQLAQNKSDFVSNVSHEIRTPLALISMFAETLEMGRIKSDEKKQEYYSIISKETARLTGIVNKILNFSLIEAGKKNLHIEPIQLTDEINAILHTYEFHLKSKGFQYQFEESQGIVVNADKEALVEIVVNLIDNAIKYSHDKKRIEISLSTENGFGTISIKDFGLGISKSDQKHIFDKFYRVSSGNLAKSQGTGLGLSLVKQLIVQQKGKISVTSELGAGSTFTIYFPLATLQ